MRAYEQAHKAEAGQDPHPGTGNDSPHPGTEKKSDLVRGTDEPILNGFKGSKKLASYEEGTPERAIHDAAVASGIGDLNLAGNRDRAIRAASGRLTTLAPGKREQVLPLFEADLKQLVTRRENKPRSWGILVSAMEDAITALASAPKRERQATTDATPQPKREPTLAEQIETLESLLSASPAHSQADDWREKLAALKRKPAESEPHAKARKAGQG